MRPKSLIFPFSWEDRHVLLQDGILFVPRYYSSYEDFVFPEWSDPAVFGNGNPVRVEFCSGNGSWLIERAKRYPAINWVAVEMKFARVRKVWSKKKNEGLDNLFIVCGEASTATKYYFPTASVEEIYINFPDPWPKKRHAKHRLVHSVFVQEVARILRPEKTFFFVTDDVDYSQHFCEEMHRNASFSPLFPAPYYRTDDIEYGTSYFADLWQSKGRTIRYHAYQREGL